jgi:type II secretory pathway pseudopilin PulG
VANPEQYKDTETCAVISALNNESGIALIVVLIVLVLLSILGATVLTTSTSELRIVGNYRNLQTAFFTADAAIEFAHTNGSIYSSLIPGTTESWPKPHEGSSTVDNNYNEITIGGNTARVKVDYVETGSVPAGSGTEIDAGLGSGSGFKANYFNVDVIGNGPNNSEVEIESYLARIIPK